MKIDSFSVRQVAFTADEFQRMSGAPSYRSRQLLDIAGGARDVAVGIEFSPRVVLSALLLARAESLQVEERGLRNFAVPMGVAALILLGADSDNWRFDGDTSELNRFRVPFFTGNCAQLNAYSRELFGLKHSRAVSEVHFHSNQHIVPVELGADNPRPGDGVPRFVFEAGALANVLRSFASGPLFFAW